jgi:hypothetical protein
MKKMNDTFYVTPYLLDVLIYSNTRSMPPNLFISALLKSNRFLPLLILRGKD